MAESKPEPRLEPIDWDRVGRIQAKYDLDTDSPVFVRSRPEIARLCAGMLEYGVPRDCHALLKARDLTKEPAISVAREFLQALKDWGYNARREYARNHPPPYPWDPWRSDIHDCPLDTLVLLFWPSETEGSHRPIPGFRRRGGQWQPLGGKARREQPPLAWLHLPQLPKV